MSLSRVFSGLSAFNRSTNCWASVHLSDARGLPTLRARLPPRDDAQKQILPLVSWNINAFHSRPIARAKHILTHILEESTCPDVIFLQEVSSHIQCTRPFPQRWQSGFLVTDAEDYASFDGVPFATMTLLSNRSFASSSVQGGIEGREKLMLEGVFRLPLPSKCGRDTLCVDITTPGAPDAILRLLNVYLDSRLPSLA